MVISKKEKKGLGIAIYGVILIGLVGFFVVCINGMENNSNTDGKAILTEAVKKTAVHCYAVEGQYPETVEYMVENYGLNYNSEKYIVKYQMIGANIMPDIFVLDGDAGD